MKLKPLGDRVIAKMVDLEENETTQSGLILTSASKDKPSVAEVVAVGPGGTIDGKKVEMYVKVGDRIIINKYAGAEVKFENEEYIVVRNSEIYAIVEG